MAAEHDVRMANDIPTRQQVELWLDRHADEVEELARDALSRHVLVLAGDGVQARELCRSHGYNPHAVWIISSAARLRGLNLDATWTILRGGTWYDRRDLGQVNEFIDICCMASGEKPRFVDVP